MRNQAFFSSHRLFRVFFPLCGTGMNTQRQIDIHTGSLKHQINTAQHHKAVFFLVPCVVCVVLSSSALSGAARVVPVCGIFASLMEYTNLTAEQFKDTVLSSLQGELYVFYSWLCAPESSIVSENSCNGPWRMTHSVCISGWHCGSMWVSSVSAVYSLLDSILELYGRRDAARNSSPVIALPLVFLHR